MRKLVEDESRRSGPIESEADRINREYEKNRTRCPRCGKWVKKTKNCRLRFHKREIAAGTFVKMYKCPASGQLPEEWTNNPR